jgi:excisionase family DNA binding protein
MARRKDPARHRKRGSALGKLTKITIQTEDLLSVPQAAKILKRPKVTLYRWIDKQKMQAVELGGFLFVPKKEVERLQDELP